jgi:hypothetical protein
MKYECIEKEDYTKYLDYETLHILRTQSLLVFSMFRGFLCERKQELPRDEKNILLRTIRYYRVFVNLSKSTGVSNYAEFANSFISFAHTILEFSGSPQAALVLLIANTKVRFSSNEYKSKIAIENEPSRTSSRTSSVIHDDFDSFSVLDYAVSNEITHLFGQITVEDLFERLWMSIDFMSDVKVTFLRWILNISDVLKDGNEFGKAALIPSGILTIYKQFSNFLSTPKCKFFIRYFSFLIIIAFMYVNLVLTDPRLHIEWGFFEIFFFFSTASIVIEELREITDEGIARHFRTSDNIYDFFLAIGLVSFLCIRFLFESSFLESDSSAFSYYLIFGCVIAISSSFRLVHGLKMLHHYGPLSKILSYSLFP